MHQCCIPESPPSIRRIISHLACLMWPIRFGVPICCKSSRWIHNRRPLFDNCKFLKLFFQFRMYHTLLHYLTSLDLTFSNPTAKDGRPISSLNLSTRQPIPRPMTLSSIVVEEKQWRFQELAVKEGVCSGTSGGGVVAATLKFCDSTAQVWFRF